jgi:hypothetical protein
MTTNAQQNQRIRPFTISAFGMTITGTYSEGYMHRNVVNGTNILFGLITWGGSETIECRPGPAVCRIENIVSFQVNRTIVNEKGEKGFQSIKVNDGSTPVVIGVGETGITFAVDITQVSEQKRGLYNSSEWSVEKAFVLAPNVVRALNLYNGPEEKGYLIPAGNYPLYKDGNIAYWTFQKPQQQ